LTDLVISFHRICIRFVMNIYLSGIKLYK